MQRNYKTIQDERELNRDDSFKSYSGQFIDEEAPVTAINIFAYFDSLKRVNFHLEFKNPALLWDFIKQCPDSIRQLSRMEESDENEQLRLDADASTLEDFVKVCISDTDAYAHNYEKPRISAEKHHNAHARNFIAINIRPENAWVIKDILFALYKFDDQIKPTFICELLSKIPKIAIPKSLILDLVSTNNLALAFEVAKQFDTTGRWLCEMGEVVSKIPDPTDTSKCHPYAKECFEAALSYQYAEDVKSEAMLNYNLLLFAADSTLEKFQRLIEGEDAHKLERQYRAFLFTLACKSYKRASHDKFISALFNVLCGYGSHRVMPVPEGKPETSLLLAQQIRKLVKQKDELKKENKRLKTLPSAESNGSKIKLGMF